MREATPLGKLAYRWAIGVGMRVAERRMRAGGRRWGSRLLHRLADYLVLDNLRRSMGLHRARGAATGAAPIAPELIRWFLALGIDMREVYGQTENCGLATAMPAPTASSSARWASRGRTRRSASRPTARSSCGARTSSSATTRTRADRGDHGDGWLHTGDVGGSTPTASCASPTA